MTNAKFRRHPLPKYARPPLAWLALCFMGLIFSPFAGFALHGQVDEAGLVLGLWCAVLPLSGLTVIAVLHWHAWRRLPAGIAEEWRHGKLIPATGGTPTVFPMSFCNDRHRIEMLGTGVVVSRSALLSMQGVKEAMARFWVAEHSGEIFIPWAEISEWQILTDNDGPDCFLLMLRPGGGIRVCRFPPDHSSECELLEAVLRIGNVPVRLHCDLDCA